MIEVYSLLVIDENDGYMAFTYDEEAVRDIERGELYDVKQFIECQFVDPIGDGMFKEDIFNENMVYNVSYEQCFYYSHAKKKVECGLKIYENC